MSIKIIYGQEEEGTWMARLQSPDWKYCHRQNPESLLYHLSDILGFGKTKEEAIDNALRNLMQLRDEITEFLDHKIPWTFGKRYKEMTLRDLINEVQDNDDFPAGLDSVIYTGSPSIVNKKHELMSISADDGNGIFLNYNPDRQIKKEQDE